MSYAGNYSILQVGKLFAGVGSIDGIKDIALEYGAAAALIITDKGVRGAGLVEKPLELLKSVGICVEVIDTVPPEPEVNHVLAVYNAAKQHHCQLIIGIGGGQCDGCGQDSFRHVDQCRFTAGVTSRSGDCKPRDTDGYGADNCGDGF